MAIVYQALSNSPCSISRGVVGAAADGLFRDMRVGNADAPLQVGYVGSIANPVFFRKLLATARILTGATSDAGLSGVALANIFWLAMRPGNGVLEATLQGTYPLGRLLDEPLVENATAMVCSNEPVPSPPPAWGVVLFENTGGASPPRYADFRFVLDASLTTDSNIYMVKLFHSVTA